MNRLSGAAGLQKYYKQDGEKEDAEEITAVGQGRQDWMKGTKLEIHSSSKNMWVVGTIADIDIDDEGEWLTVLYELPTPDGGFSSKNKRSSKKWQRCATPQDRYAE